MGKTSMGDMTTMNNADPSSSNNATEDDMAALSQSADSASRLAILATTWVHSASEVLMEIIQATCSDSVCLSLRHQTCSLLIYQLNLKFRCPTINIMATHSTVTLQWAFQLGSQSMTPMVNLLNS